MKKYRKKNVISMKNIQIKWMFPLFLGILELLFHIEIYRKFDFNMLHAILFSFPFSFFILLLSNTKWKLWNSVIRCIAALYIGIYVIVQIVYYYVFGNFLCMKSIVNGTGQAFDFGYTIKDAVWNRLYIILPIIVIMIVYICGEIFNYRKEKQNKENREEKKERRKRGFLYLGIIIVVPIFGTLFLMFEGRELSSAYDVRMNFYRIEQSMYRLGFTETLTKDVREKLCDLLGVTQNQYNAGYLWVEKNLFKEDKKSIHDGKIKTENKSKDNKKERNYHIWEIDFEGLKENTTDQELLDVHNYFSNIEPTAENKYTGLFEGYNLVYITAESFSDVVIDKERTPTLYKMWGEGFQFENFYTPSWYLSTIDGEYVNCLGQIPVEGQWSLQESSKTDLPMALGNQLSKIGYTCNAYHNHDSYYYDRMITHPNLGYSFKAIGSGLTFESMYPESDLELMEITKEEYIGKAPFHTYYITMSGHLPYTYEYNSMATKNKEIVEEMELTENAACYLAANQELEYAMTYLMKELEKKNQLSKTLFVIAPDHYPYGLKKGAYDELKGEKVEQDVFEIYRNTCLIWSPSMKEMDTVSFPVKVKKYGSNLDLLPTISNLMGISYDSRLLAGRDLLSEDMGLIMFKDHSFMTDRVRYNATTGEAIWSEGEMEDMEYLENCMQIVRNRFYYSAEILNKDYMSFIVDSKQK